MVAVYVWVTAIAGITARRAAGRVAALAALAWTALALTRLLLGANMEHRGHVAPTTVSEARVDTSLAVARDVLAAGLTLDPLRGGAVALAALESRHLVVDVPVGVGVEIGEQPFPVIGLAIVPVAGDREIALDLCLNCRGQRRPVYLCVGSGSHPLTSGVVIGELLNR
jgi:hypothetical protein